MILFLCFRKSLKALNSNKIFGLMTLMGRICNMLIIHGCDLNSLRLDMIINFELFVSLVLIMLLMQELLQVHKCWLPC